MAKDIPELTMGEKIFDLLAAKGETNATAAKAMGMSPSLLSDVINGKKKQGITSDTLAKICRYFGVSADYLLGLSEVSSTNEDVKVAVATTGLSEQGIEALGLYGAREKSTLSKLLCSGDMQALVVYCVQLSDYAKDREAMLQESVDDPALANRRTSKSAEYDEIIERELGSGFKLTNIETLIDLCIYKIQQSAIFASKETSGYNKLEKDIRNGKYMPKV